MEEREREENAERRMRLKEKRGKGEGRHGGLPSERELLTRARGIARRGICLAYVENLVHSPGIVMGAFRLLVCNIRNSCLPVCRLLPVRDVPIGASETRVHAMRKWYYLCRRGGWTGIFRAGSATSEG